MAYPCGLSFDVLGLAALGCSWHVSSLLGTVLAMVWYRVLIPEFPVLATCVSVSVSVQWLGALFLVPVHLVRLF